MTELKARQKVVTKAKSHLGEKESNGSHKKIIDTYNGHKPLARGYKVKYTDDWCATFGSAVAIEVGYTDIIPTECSCERQIELWKKKGRWQEKDSYVPDAGDYIYYDWDDSGEGNCTGHSDHVGIVSSVKGDVITVIEGNKSNAVETRTIKVNAKHIRGYGLPNYKSKATKSESKNKGRKSVTEVSKEVIQGKWGNGADRKKRLEAAGYNYSAVQKKVNEMT